MGLSMKELVDRTVIPGVLKGMKITLKHMLTPRAEKVTPTIQYPEEKAPSFKRTRGVHYMKQDEEGRTNCVACFMCSTACPAEAITIVQTSAPKEWKDRDTYPASYIINELRCIYCGMCEEACPKDAIHLSNTHAPVFHSREEAMYDLTKLTKNWHDVKETGQVRFDT